MCVCVSVYSHIVYVYIFPKFAKNMLMEFFLKSIRNVISLTYFKKLFFYVPSHIHTGQDTQRYSHLQPPPAFITKRVGFFH